MSSSLFFSVIASDVRLSCYVFGCPFWEPHSACATTSDLLLSASGVLSDSFVADHRNLEPPETKHNGSAVHLLRWQALRQAVNASIKLKAETPHYAAKQKGGDHHLQHSASMRAAERASLRGCKEDHVPAGTRAIPATT